MTISMYQASVPVCVRTLTNLANVLKKGEQFADTKKIKPEVLLNSRIAVDMYPLVKQVQIASDTSKGMAARLAGIDNPKFEDNEQTFADLHTRINRTIEFLNTIKPGQIDGTEEKTIVLKFGPNETRYSGINYLLGFVLPNLGFHVTTAYNILRHHGVELGKRDYLGPAPT
jgi:hypothetical protein